MPYEPTGTALRGNKAAKSARKPAISDWYNGSAGEIGYSRDQGTLGASERLISDGSGTNAHGRQAGLPARRQDTLGPHEYEAPPPLFHMGAYLK